MEAPHTACRTDRWIVTALVAAALAVFLQCAWHDFLNFDDDIYVYENFRVKTGLTWDNALWAFVAPRIGHWHPLTWWSLMLDNSWYGLWPGGFHLTSLALHLAAGLLLYRFLRRATLATGPSAAVAFLFLVHPLHVEPVAWIASRKDVLSGACLMAALLAYIQYVRRPTAIRYSWVVLWYVLGIMAKSMLMTFPVLLLLLDYWPLGRWRGAWKSCLIEKTPLFLIAILSSAIALRAGYGFDAIGTSDNYPLAVRLANTPVNYAIYLWRTVWPAGLAPNYPLLRGFRPWPELFAAPILLLAVTAGVWAGREKRPYLLIGWLWFLVAMFPVSGVVQVGGHATADRYTYVPLIGIFIMAAWTGKEVLDASPRLRSIGHAVCGVIAVVLVVLSIRQTHFWRTPVELWRHTLEVTRFNDKAMLNLGNELLARGQYDEAAAQYQNLLRLKPDDVDAQINVAKTCAMQGQTQEAMRQLQETVSRTPGSSRAHLEIGRLHLKLGNLQAALPELAASVHLKPDEPTPHYEYGRALMTAGQWGPAAVEFKETFELDITYAPALVSLGLCRAAESDFAAAADCFSRARHLRPGNFEACFNLGLALQKLGRNAEAAEALEEACRLKPADAEAKEALRIVRESLTTPAASK